MAKVSGTFLDIDEIDIEAVGLKKDALKGEVAVVTGSTSNVGLGYARAIARAGGMVVVSGNNEKNGNEIARVINAENNSDSAIFVKCDVTKDGDIKNLAQKAIEKFGKVDILILNAMNLGLNGPVLKSPISDFENATAIAGRSVMVTLQEFVPAMVERKHGVVIYSTTQFHYCPPMIGGAVYTATKAAATSLVMSLANELGPVENSGVSVFCVAPAGINSPYENRIPTSPDGRDMSKAPPFQMPGFNGPIPPEAGGAAIVHCINNAVKLHRSGVIMSDALYDMKYPYPNPETAVKRDMRRLSDMELTMVLCNMGPGFDA